MKIRSLFSLILLAVSSLPSLALQVYTPQGTMDAGFAVTESWKATYTYQAQDYVPAATPTDVICVKGSATKVIRINRVQVTADATGSSVIDLYFYKRTTANTGGTSTNPTPVKHDSIDPAASAAVVLYSANPTGLGAGGLVSADHYMIPATSGNQYFSAPPWVEDFGRVGKTIVLRGVAESFCFNLNGQTLPAGFNVYVRYEWTEE